jgi:hypothetical protein
LNASSKAYEPMGGKGNENQFDCSASAPIKVGYRCFGTVI